MSLDATIWAWRAEVDSSTQRLILLSLAGQADLWLMNDCKWVDACLDKHIKVKLNQNQFNALASFVYNVGETAFVKSTMLTLLNQSKFGLAANQFDRWIYDNGKVINGLVNRRAKEKLLFLK